MRSFLVRHEDRLLMVVGVAGALLFTIGAAFAVMVFEHGASHAMALMMRNAPVLAWLAPFGLALFVWMLVDGLTSRESL